jgi:CMP-N-acetylneuraminic acid synthetase
MKVVNVLLARTNYCKRIQQKPLVKLGGVHLIEWTLQIMKQLKYESYVFTDNETTKEIVESYGLNVRDKLLENKEGIHYTSEELKEYNKEMKADVIVLFQLTSPFRDFKTVQNWIDNFPLYSVNVAFTVRPINLNLYMENGDRIWPINRTYQNNQTLYKETGSVYIFHKKQIEKTHLTNGKRKLLIDSYNFDIDTYDDLERAEMFLKKEQIKAENYIFEEKK